LVKSKNSASDITSATITVISTCCPICRVDGQQFHFPVAVLPRNVHPLFGRHDLRPTAMQLETL
jgi:hypothetical protein